MMTETEIATARREGLVERIARVIDPSTWQVLDGYLADVKRKHKGENVGYDPEAFRDKKSLAKADVILGFTERPEVGWLIERNGQWYAAAPHTDWTIKQAINNRHAENWTHDANEALRFSRKVDAETLIRFVGWQHATATEHAFIARGAPDGR